MCLLQYMHLIYPLFILWRFILPWFSAVSDFGSTIRQTHYPTLMNSVSHHPPCGLFLKIRNHNFLQPSTSMCGLTKAFFVYSFFWFENLFQYFLSSELSFSTMLFYQASILPYYRAHHCLHA